MSEAHAGMMVTPSVRLVRPLGEGGMGSVWVAEHLALRTQVVVKFISSDLKGSAEARQRFSVEAAAASQVKSPHVVQTFDHGITDGGIPYIVMELLEGRDLGAVLDDRTKLEPELVLEIVAQLARALDRAHERGIVHRDIKPGNVFLCDAGGGEVFVKLLDFGIAKGVDVPRVDSHTKTGSMIGSPFYMSPEQILGSKGVDHRSDLWSVGVLTFEALTGAKPFDAETMGGLAIKIHSEPLPQLTALAPYLPAAVDAWFQRACARDVNERFGSAKELAEALAAALGGQMPRSVEVPRISTGSSDVSARAPTLVAGATTEAGLVRPTTQAKTRTRVLGLLGVLVAGVLAFVAVRAFKASGAPDARGLVAADPGPSASKVEQAAGAAAPPPTTAAPPATLTPTTVASTEATPQPPASDPPKPAPPTTKAGGHRPRPKDTGHAASPPPLPSSAPTPPPRPTSSGHDIF